MADTHEEAGLWEDGDYREVRGLGQSFRTKGELKAKGYAFAFRYGSDALAKAMAWLDFPELREFRKQIETGPLGLRDALDAAFLALSDPRLRLTDDHILVLREHVGNWFGPAAEVRRMLLALVTIDEILCEVEQLDQKATPGPWVREMARDGEHLPDGTGYAGDWHESNGIARAAGPDNDEHDVGEAWSGSDAALIAAYRSHAPALAAEVRRLRAQIDDLRRRG